jgi:hypothetical protein
MEHFDIRLLAMHLLDKLFFSQTHKKIMNAR